MQQITLTTFSIKHLIFLASLAIGLVATATSARSEQPEQVQATDKLAVQVELLTMGPGPKLFARFGHAALRVRRADGFDRVYNFGYTRFDNPWLVWDFLRGAALFWAESSSWPETVLNYQDDDRALMRQVLNLTPTESHALARRLERAVGPKSHYVYDHFANNCSTRLRDLIDDATGHALRRALRKKPVKGTLRDRVREGFAGRLEILVGIALVMGRETDRPITRWEAAFLPAELSSALHDVKHHGHPLAGPPIVVMKRRGPNPNPGDPRAGVLILWLVTMGLLILGGMGLLALRNGQRRASLAVLLLALVLGVLSLPPWILFAVTRLPALAPNELTLVFWPTDLLLAGFAFRLLRRRLFAGRWLRGYLTLRLSVLALTLLLHLPGWFGQPLVWSILAAT
ncbi:MAG: DUF4105 domain-containing protein, partial [Deltaproteobacteria bacterium]|nr:DUF4105 domain-containing protein [Deltaproteobacteria bacterium]